jgi:NADH-quinone oxidoreductase subunit L
MIQYAWLIPLVPFVGFLINGLFGNKLSKNTVSFIGCGSVAVSFIIVATLFLQSLSGALPASNSISLGDWISAGSFHVSFSLLIDHLTLIMLLIITGVGLLIHIYSIGYMHDDTGYARFFSYLNLFIFFMLVLVLGSNFLILFIGWEGVGLCSYLLIGFWFKNGEYNKAANKAFIMNRIGDLGFLLGIFLIFLQFGSLEFSTVFQNADTLTTGGTTVTAITLLLFIGATGKSAQIPLFTWLPDAMAGPTPVSALIHAATMVTAGVYMIARSNVLYTLAPFTMALIAVIGALTALMAGIIALTQTDIKKVLAYSTVSQLGYMFAALGVSAFSSAIFHLMTHAFFKALLFLAAGSVIHALGGEQNIRKMGGLKKYLPITFPVFLIGVLAISGCPPFAGFFSKDEIISASYNYSISIFLILEVTAILTAAYMFRLLFLVFFGDTRLTHHKIEHIHESPSSVTIPLVILAILSTIGGFAGLPYGAPNAIHNYLTPVFSANPTLIAQEGSSSVETLVIIITIITLIAIYYWADKQFAKKHIPEEIDENKMPWWYKLSYNKFYVDEIYNTLVVRPLNALSREFMRVFERHGIDATVDSSGDFVVYLSSILKNLQQGNIGFYVLMMVLGVVVFILIKLFT